MSGWKKEKESVFANASVTFDGRPFGGNWTQDKKRDVVATDVGYVYRQVIGSRVKDEILVAIGNLANSTNLGFPNIVDVYFSSNSSGGTALDEGDSANVYVVFNEPVKHSGLAGGLQLTVANSVGSNVTVAYANSGNGLTDIIRANNTVVFSWTVPAAGGTFTVDAGDVANSTLTAANLVSYNTGNESANLHIEGYVSNNVTSVTSK